MQKTGAAAPGEAPSPRAGQRPAAALGDSEVGLLLRQTRASFGQSLAEVARDIRIRQSFLEAIEAGRFETLPGQAYTIGFIRTYAEHLGLDPNEVVRRFKRESGVGTPAAKLNFPAPLAESGVPKGAILLVGAVLALVGYGIWYLTSSRYLDVAELTVPLPEHLRQILPGGGEAAVVPGQAPVPLPKVEMPLDARPDAATPAPAPAVTEPAAAPVPAAAPPATPLAVPPAGGEAAATTAAAVPAAAPAMDGSRVLLRVTADAWVEVRDPGTRSVLVSRLMRAGEAFAVPDRPGLTLLTGNAGGLEVVIDGQPVAPLGKSGTVRRGVPLDAEQLRVSLTPAAPPPPAN